jgi:methionyl aminopeptidase
VVLRRRRGIEIKTQAQLLAMRRAGLVVAQTLERIAAVAAPGVTTAELDSLAREVLAECGATSSFLGYAHPPFPAVICASVNDEVVHGIPGPRTLRSGDVLSVDFGAIVEGWHGDAAVTMLIGEVPEERRVLSEVTEQALWAGLAAARVGNRLSDISHAVESSIRSTRRPDGGPWGMLREYGGHGIGTQMHMDPHVLNFGPPGRGPALHAGMALAIEPMVTLGSDDVRVAEDDWTVITADGAAAAHWEHTVAITGAGPWVLTAKDGGAQWFAAHGIASPAGDLE